MGAWRGRKMNLWTFPELKLQLPILSALGMRLPPVCSRIHLRGSRWRRPHSSQTPWQRCRRPALGDARDRSSGGRTAVLLTQSWRPPVLSTPRLMLRPITDADATDIFLYSCNPNITRFTLWNTHESLDDTILF